ncbi:hypothetical protein F4804DRAFT_336917 [Jackrogersella minutella]|nr:hypothetical protein F4804DRAFT_336917 [Jackrogersella minutella]
MLSSLPTRVRDTRATVSSYYRAEIIAIIYEFYAAIVKLPYIDPDALVQPPPEGWTGLREDELRKRGKTDEVIALLRHLPYLRNQDKKWMLSPDTMEIAYCDGEMYGTITEWAMLGGRLMLPYDEYEQLDKADKWMAHPTFPARDFFQLWKARWEKLVWIPVYDPQGHNGNARWWSRAIPGSDDEDAILSPDDDFKPDSDDEETDSSSEIESEDDDDDAALSDREVDDIFHEAFGEEAQNMRAEFASEPTFTSTGPVPRRTSLPGRRLDRHELHEEHGKAVYEIYKRNGWPSNFDRERCKLELEEFRQTISHS